MSISHSQRQALVDTLYWFHKHSNLWPYVQERPFPLRTRTELEALFTAGQPVEGYDCSGSSVQACYVTGLKDPTGYNFAGFGNTQSVLGFLKAHYTDPRKAQPGAFVVFNADRPLSEQHMSIIGDEGAGTANPILFTHGGPGFQRMRLEELQASFSGQTVFCSPAPLG